MDYLPTTLTPATLPAQIEATNIEDLFSGTGEIDELAQGTSPHIALLLLKHFRGATVVVARNMKSDNILAQKLGFENAKILSDYMFGGRITVPSRHPAHVFVLESQVAMYVEAGLSRSEIATELGISDRQVRRVTSRIGLSGISYVFQRKAARSVPLGDICKPQSLPTPSESDFNGGSGVFCCP